MIELSFDGSFAGWKRVARGALTQQLAPSDVHWIDQHHAQSQLGFPSFDPAPSPTAETEIRVPRDFAKLAADVSCFRDPTRWALLYRVLWRLTHDEPHLLEVAVDPDVHALRHMAKTIGREVHKMHAFVRFREVATSDGSWFVAWFEPAHDIVELAAPFFVGRFAAMRWSILTPDRCAHWDGKTLTFSPGVDRSAAPAEDAKEELWRSYYGSIFNPARVKTGAMVNEMPRRYWKNLPEAEIIPQLLQRAPTRTDQMLAASAARRATLGEFSPAPVPATRDIALLRDAAATCRACPLWRNATCTVFGEGPKHPRIVVVGEQPGDQEDRTGQPFVGPAGKLFDRALVAAGVDRAELYVTNAVKHFKWEPRGKRRIHQKPNAREVAACRPWLEAELHALAPKLIVCLGATAAQSVLKQPSVRVLTDRGQKFPTEFGAPALVTVHPSSLLRLPDPSQADSEFEKFVADLRQIRGLVVPHLGTTRTAPWHDRVRTRSRLEPLRGASRRTSPLG